jgi:hypothetical protein
MKDINKEIEKTLQSWDNIERLEANPFLYTRIEQKIKALETPRQTNRVWYWQPLLVAALVILNFFTIATALNSSKNQSVYDTIAEQYNISTDTENTFNFY